MKRAAAARRRNIEDVIGAIVIAGIFTLIGFLLIVIGGSQ